LLDPDIVNKKDSIVLRNALFALTALGLTALCQTSSALACGEDELPLAKPQAQKVMPTPTILIAEAEQPITLAVVTAPRSPYRFYGLLESGYTIENKLYGDYKIARNDYSDTSRAKMLGLGIGMHVMPHVRAELAITERRGMTFKYSAAGNGAGDISDFGSQHVRSTAFFLNSYYDIATVGRFTPYVGAGLGYVINRNSPFKIYDNIADIERNYSGKATKGLGYQLRAGTAIAINDRMSLDLGYRYAMLGKVATKATGTHLDPDYPQYKGNLRAHEATVGLRFAF
jgi:opacity protein-like surface antigen